MIYSRPWDSYRQITAQTSSPGQLVLMLYDGAIRFLERSLGGFELEDPAEFNETISNNVIRAQNIINELNNTLNMEEGGTLAQTLRRLYNYMEDQLLQSNMRKQPDGIRDTIRRLTILRDAWQEMLQQRNATATPSATYANSPSPNAARPAEIPSLASLCACV